MDSAALNIGTKEYIVRFDFKAARYITEGFGFKSYGDVQQQFIDLGFDKINFDFSFPQYEFLSKLVLFAIQSIPSNKATGLKREVVEEYLFDHLDETMGILKVYEEATYKRMGKMNQNPQPA